MSSIKFDSVKFFVSCGFIIHIKMLSFALMLKQKIAAESRKQLLKIG